MKAIAETYRTTGIIHHAYLVEAFGQDAVEGLFAALETELGVARAGNPDFWYGEYTTFGVDDARALREKQMLRPVAGGRKIFVVKAVSMTQEAQNALLKVLEEPTEGTHVFIIVPSLENVLPTLKSRAHALRAEESGGGYAEDAAAFLSADQSSRAKLIKKYVDSSSDDKDKEPAIRFVSALERALRDRADLPHAGEKAVFALTETERVRGYLLDRSPSVKQLLEHLSAVVPRAK